MLLMEKVFDKIKNLGQYHDFYVQRDKLLLADVFASLRNMSIELYELYAARFPTAPGVA